MANLFNQQAFEATLGNELHEAMRKAAEPILQRALAEMEQRMREQLGAMLVGFVTTSYNLERDGRNLLIRVHLGKNEVQK
jgi:hypothetical protein